MKPGTLAALPGTFGEDAYGWRGSLGSFILWLNQFFMFALKSTVVCTNCKGELVYKLTGFPRACPNCKVVSLRRSLLLAAFIFFFDAFFSNLGVISILALLTTVLIRLPLIAWAAWRKETALCVNRAMRAGIYVAMALLVFVANALNNLHARKKGDILVAACLQYKDKHQKFPDKLDDLVPEFIPDVPRAKFVIGFGQFRYWTYDERHWLEYTEEPPFGRQYYILEEGAWKFMD